MVVVAAAVVVAVVVMMDSGSSGGGLGGDGADGVVARECGGGGGGSGDGTGMGYRHVVAGLPTCLVGGHDAAEDCNDTHCRLPLRLQRHMPP